MGVTRGAVIAVNPVPATAGKLSTPRVQLRIRDRVTNLVKLILIGSASNHQPVTGDLNNVAITVAAKAFAVQRRVRGTVGDLLQAHGNVREKYAVIIFSKISR